MISGRLITSMTLNLGLIDANGSWKIICISRRKAFNSSSLNKLNGNSLYQIKPSDTSFRPTTVLANVDFPDPDSPTMPNVSPFLIAKLISLTARYRLPLGDL